MCGTNNDLYIVSSTCEGEIYFNLFNILLILDSFPVTMATWAFHDKCSSDMIPK